MKVVSTTYVSELSSTKSKKVQVSRKTDENKKGRRVRPFFCVWKLSEFLALITRWAGSYIAN